MQEWGMPNRIENQGCKKRESEDERETPRGKYVMEEMNKAAFDSSMEWEREQGLQKATTAGTRVSISSVLQVATETE